MTDSGIERLAGIERINVVGTSGSGKSTFARQLADALGLPYVEMDRIFWKADWTETPDEEFLPQVESITGADQWVLDGNYIRTTPIKWCRVQLVVWLDMPFLRTLYRVTSRCVRRSVTRAEIWPGTGNRETLRKAFLSRDSVIWWSLTTYRRHRREYAGMMAAGEYPHIWFVRLRSPAEVAVFLQTAHAAGASSRPRG